MNRLIVDNSNTRTKFALLTGDAGLKELRVLQTADVTVESVRNLVRGWEYESVHICSVVPLAAQEIAAAFQGMQVAFLSPQMLLEVDFSHYEGIATLGADRVANALAAVQEGAGAVVAVDMGTATTVDVVVQQRGKWHFMGGVIAPGVAAFADSLTGRTALLPVASGDYRGPVIGKTTLQAMSSAVYVGYPAMIDGVLDEIERELGQRIHVVLTGGDSGAIAPRMRRRCRLEPMLTLKGIARAFGMRV